jgi:hypothetical protein
MAELNAPACRLDASGRHDQAERYRRLRASVADVRRGEDAMDVTFAPTVDLSLLRETVDVERGCCPFLDLELDAGAPALRIAVADSSHRPALSTLAEALRPEHAAA